MSTPNHMPDAETLERLRNAPAGPIVVLNLLKYREPGGRDAFARYGQITGPLIGEARGRVLFGGKAVAALTGTDIEWDDVLILRFPSAQLFLAMIESETYTAQAAPIRAEALEATLWLAMHPFPGFEGEDA
jgi:uncharacterized protein (DUF1330 family)